MFLQFDQGGYVELDQGGYLKLEHTMAKQVNISTTPLANVKIADGDNVRVIYRDSQATTETLAGKYQGYDFISPEGGIRRLVLAVETEPNKYTYHYLNIADVISIQLDIETVTTS